MCNCMRIIGDMRMSLSVSNRRCCHLEHIHVRQIICNVSERLEERSGCDDERQTEQTGQAWRQSTDLQTSGSQERGNAQSGKSSVIPICRLRGILKALESDP